MAAADVSPELAATACEGLIQAGKALPFVDGNRAIFAFSLEKGKGNYTALAMHRPDGKGPFKKDVKRYLLTKFISRKIIESLEKNGEMMLMLTPGHVYTSMQVDERTGLIFFIYVDMKGLFGVELLNMRSHCKSILCKPSEDFRGAVLSRSGRIFVISKSAVSVYNIAKLDEMPTSIVIEFGSELPARWAFCTVLDEAKDVLFLTQPASVTSGDGDTSKQSKSAAQRHTDGLLLFPVAGRLRSHYISSDVTPSCTGISIATVKENIIAVCPLQDLMGESEEDPFKAAARLFVAPSTADQLGIFIEKASREETSVVRVRGIAGQFCIINIVHTAVKLFIVARVCLRDDKGAVTLVTDCISVDLTAKDSSDKIATVKRLDAVLPDTVKRVYLSGNDLILRILEPNGQQTIRCFNSSAI
jgi:hypothetical protein